MNRILVWWMLLAAILIQRGLAVPTITENPEDDDEDFDDEDEDSSEADDDGRIYKNPRNSPSTECPRDEEQATLLGQKCLRKCSSDEDCKSKKKKCLCDGACGMSCIKPDRECPELPKPPLGDVVVSDRHFGSRATYHCPHGYHVVGLQSRLCQADGHWAGQEPTCKENIYCLTPPVVEHARHSALPEQATFDLDSTVQYHCHTGYVTNGFPRAKCLAIDGQASWYGPDIQCEPRSCGQPPDPANGWHAGECYNFGCRVIYHCGEGYELVGKPERYCQADGSWTPKELPTCVLVTSVQCPVPENPKNGKAIYTTFSYNSVVSYECKYGYMLVGESSRRCGADRKWSGTLPTCKEINCGHPGVLYNGWIENIQSGTGLGASIIFRCHTEMLLEGLASSICLIDGKWSHSIPQCLAPCIVPTISQGQVNPVEIEIDVNTTTTIAPVVTSVGKVRHGTSLEVICDTNYEFPASALSTPTCNNGTWSIIPRCIPARCKTMPKPPKHGMVLAPKTEHGMKARFKCKDGFNLTAPIGKEMLNPNDYVLTCSFGNWTGETPICQEVYCAFPGFIQNGKVLLVGNMGLYDYRPYVKKIVNNKQIMYDCDKGYVLDEGPPGATCVGGRWRPTNLPKCLPGQHPRLRFNRKRRSIGMRNHRSKFLLEHARRLQKFLEEELITKHRDHERNRRDSFQLTFSPSIRYAQKRIFRNLLVRNKRKTKPYDELPHKRPSKNLHTAYRNRRDPSEMQRAYSKFYEKLKQKYQNYVKNLLGYNRSKTPSAPTPQNSPANRLLGENNNPTKKIQVQDGRWFNTYNSPDFVTRYKVTHKTRIASSDLDSDEESYLNSFNELQLPTTISHLNQLDSNLAKKEIILGDIETSVHELPLPGSIHHNDHLYLLSGPKILMDNTLGKNLTHLIAQLKSQIVRRKRSADSVAGGQDGQDNGEDRKTRPRPTCEELNLDAIANVTVIRQGKSPGRNNPGTIVHIACHSGFKLNIKNPNATARCVRGIWKPQKPMCLSAPCTTPSAEHGRYYEVSPDPMMTSNKPNLRLLTLHEEVGNEQIVTFQCDNGFNVQGPAQMRCIQGSWAVTSYPECIPMPCVLPSIPNVVYEGGYRAGLTVAHGSSVTVHCDNPANSLPIQIICSQGVMSPPSIHCETGMRRSREEYLGEADFTNHDNSLQELFSSSGSNSPNLNPMISNGEGSNEQNGSGRDCGPPNRLDAALVYNNGDNIESEEGFPTGTEITFNCISSIAGERNTWKIICDDGNWIGRSWSCANGTCLFRNNEPNVVSFYNDLEIREDVVEFPPGATIISRCVDIGKYAIVGSGVRTCIHSEWSGQKPSCFGLNQENDYAMEKAPTVLFRHQNGPIAQSNNGKLIVYPGTTVHMECLWMRRFGNPKWNVSHDYRSEFRTYPEGWVTEDGRDPQLEYRLSIFHAVEDDSGIFTCQTPARHEHSVDVLVKSINCPDIPIRRGLMVSTNDTKLSTRVQLSCANGNSLIGASELLCLPSGNWSAPLPVCESVECGDLPLPMNATSPRVAVLSREVGGRAAFSCPSGYGLRGQTESICLPSGEWATPFPTCIEVQCDNPGAPQNGYAQGSAPYRAGDVVQFNCNPEYMMQGQPIIACQDNGRWSGGLPKCVQACSYPGTAISGRMSSVKFYYAIGESITFTCDAGLELRGAKMLKCLRNGKWSNAIPTCVSANSEQSTRNSGHSG